MDDDLKPECTCCPRHAPVEPKINVTLNATETGAELVRKLQEWIRHNGKI